MSNAYLLAGGRAELERLRLQAQVWEPDSDALFDAIPVQRDWHCVDVGCGAMGVLRSLSKRAASVVGVDTDRNLLDAAQAFVEEQQLANVTLRQANLFEDDLGTFDLAHLRFMFAPIGRDAELRERALALVKPGGVLVVQEPDSATWNMLPPHPRFEELKRVILEAFRLGGGDFDAGRRTFALLRDAGLRDVQIRAAVHALQDAHPYMRVALQFAASLRPRITRFLSESELDALVADVEQLVSAEGNAALTFTVTQVWGQVPV